MEFFINCPTILKIVMSLTSVVKTGSDRTVQPEKTRPRIQSGLVLWRYCLCKWTGPNPIYYWFYYKTDNSLEKENSVLNKFCSFLFSDIPIKLLLVEYLMAGAPLNRAIVLLREDRPIRIGIGRVQYVSVSAKSDLILSRSSRSKS